jgi:hypothetical protein
MNREERQQILKANYINERDLFLFKWRVPQVLCEAPESWGGLTDIELIFRSALGGFENYELMQAFLRGKGHSVYKAIIDEVADDLVRRRIVVKEDMTIPYEDFDMNRYSIGPALTGDKRGTITTIGSGDPKLFDQLFPIHE